MAERNRSGKSTVMNVIVGLLIGILAVSVAFFTIVAIAEVKRGKNPEQVASDEPSTDDIEPGTDDTTPEPTTEFVSPYRTIERLSGDRLAEIGENYSDELHEYQLWTDGEVDDDNRPAMANRVEKKYENTADGNVSVYCADSGTKQVAFMFTANIETGFTETILDILAENKVPATFFISNYYARTMPESVERMIKDGHEVGNGSYTAPEEGIAAQNLEAQMDDALKMQSYMDAAFDYVPKTYLFNGGIYSDASVQLMAEMGFQVCFGSVNYDDYFVNREYDSKETLEMLEGKLHNGCIYSLHMTNSITVSILEELIGYCRQQGYEIVAIPYI